MELEKMAMTLNQVKQMNENPWKALMPYEVEDKNIFFGRDKDITELTSLIEYNQMVTLYGKSGVGKSSLLNAGVSPRLTMDGLQPYTIRLKSEKDFECNDVSFAEMILSHLSKKKKNIDYVSKDVFCRFFEKYESYNDYGEKVTPVIILDQFEDTLIHNETKAELLLKQIVAWTNNKKEIVSDCHFVISIREDDLYLLEEVLDKNRLNALKLSRYRLRNINRDDAEEIICKGGKGLIKEDSVVERILQILRRESTEYFEASELSLMCSQLFKLMKRQKMDYISVDMVEKTGISSIKEYYKSIIEELKMSKEEIDAFEREFVTDSGRRSFISVDKYKKLFRHDVCTKLLAPQSQYRILTETNGKIEIVHDLLAKAIKAVKDEHNADNLKQTIKQEIIICYLSLLPILLVVLIALYLLLPPVLVFLNEKGISSFYDIMDFPVIMNRVLWLLAVPILWMLPWIFLKSSEFLLNIDLKYFYRSASCIYWGVILYFIWFIYWEEGLTTWAKGINTLPFIACGLWFIDNNGSVKNKRKNIVSFSYLFFMYALGLSVLGLQNYNIFNVFAIFVYFILGLFFYDKIKLGLKIVISLFLFFYGIYSYGGENEVFIFLFVLLLTLIFICISYKKQISLCFLYLFLIIGTVIFVCQTNPYYLLKYNNNIRLIPNTAFITTQSDSVYIKDAWCGNPYIDWPLIAKDGTTFGILPVKDSLQLKTDFGLTMPFVKYIENEGYEIVVNKFFFEGINEGLKEEVIEKLAYIKSDTANISEYDSLKIDIIYPIKLHVADMFTHLMGIVNGYIRNQISLNADANIFYGKIDSLCRNYIDGFKEKIKSQNITENDLYYYYKITICQLVNTLIQECLDRNDIHGTIRSLSFMVYLNLSENQLYSNVNTTYNVNIIDPYMHDSSHYYMISGNIIDDEMDIVKIRNIYEIALSIAKVCQTQWQAEDIAKRSKSSGFTDKNKLNSILKYDYNPYLKSFCNYQKSILKRVVETLNWDNNIYRSYLEKIGEYVLRIQWLQADKYLISMYENNIVELKEKKDTLSEYLKEIENAYNELMNVYGENEQLLMKEYKRLLQQLSHK